MNIKSILMNNKGLCIGIIISTLIILVACGCSFRYLTEAGDRINLMSVAISGLVFLWLIAGYHLQREELVAQRKELELQREELNNQYNALLLQKNELHQTNKHGALHQIYIIINNFTNSLPTKGISELKTVNDIHYLALRRLNIVSNTIEKQKSNPQIISAYEELLIIKYICDDLMLAAWISLTLYTEYDAQFQKLELGEFFERIQDDSYFRGIRHIPFISLIAESVHHIGISMYNNTTLKLLSKIDEQISVSSIHEAKSAVKLAKKILDAQNNNLS